MRFSEALKHVHEMQDDEVLLATVPWSASSEAKFARFGANFSLSSEDLEGGFSGVLDKEDLTMLLGYADEKVISQELLADFVLHYAIYDGYPSWFSDLPDK
jgi:hypothetical protein